MCKTLQEKQKRHADSLRKTENHQSQPVPYETMADNILKRTEALQNQQENQTERSRFQRADWIRLRLPEETIRNNTYAVNSTSIKCAIKRNREAKTQGTVLYNKRLNAETVEAASEAWEAQLKRRTLAVAMEHDDTFLTGRGGREVAQFLTDDQEMNQRLIHGLNGEEGSLKRLGRACYEQIMNLDFNLDLRNDVTFARASARMEEITRKVDAWYRLSEEYEGIDGDLSEEEKRLLEEKMDRGKGIACYYRLRRKVITNSYYRTHYNSEISHRFNMRDSLQQKNLAMLLWQAEAAGSSESMDATLFSKRWITNHNEEYTDEDIVYAHRARAGYAQVNINAEYGKIDPMIEDSPHADYFRQHNHENDPVNKRLTGSNYRVTGMDVEMSESFVRHLSNLPRWRAVQEMPADEVRAMIQNLTREPRNKENPDPQDVEECRQANMEGLRQFKNVLKRHTDYLKRKYGNGFILLSYQEFVDHAAEFQNDFTNMQGLGQFVAYIKKLPGLFDPSDVSDVDMDKTLAYFERCCLIEGMAKNAFVAKEIRSFSQFKMQTSQWIGRTPYNEQAGAVFDKIDTMHLDIKWNEPFYR